VDDPYLFGQIAAANSLSDIYAMGATPLFALNIVCFPINELPKSILTAILQGGIDKATEAGISIVGGHSVDDHEPKYGLVVTGVADKHHLIRNNGAQPGDSLILTKPLGTGIIATAIKKGQASQKQIDEAVESMSALNKAGADAMKNVDIHSATDITGFGLLGHLREMCIASNVSAEIDFLSLTFFHEVRELADKGIMPGGSKRNFDFIKDDVMFSKELTSVDKLLCSDAQTSGGLLVSIPEKAVSDYLDQFDSDYFTQPVVVGRIVRKNSQIISVL